MRIGIPTFDNERERMARIIELLDVNPENGIRGEFFLDRLGILKVVLTTLYAHEELLMNELKLPAEMKARHFEDHTRIFNLFNQVYEDSMQHADRKAIDVYQMLRSNIEKHILDFGMQLKSYVSPP